MAVFEPILSLWKGPKLKQTSVFNNADTWSDISSETIKKLDGLQNMMIRYLFDTPRTTPTPSLSWDTGMLTMRYRILQKQLNLVCHLSTLGDATLAKQIYLVQRDFGFPGLITQSKSAIKNLNLPDILTSTSKAQDIVKASFKSSVKKAVTLECEQDLKQQFTTYSKLKSGPMVEERFSKRAYIDSLVPDNARQLFKFRSKMFDAKLNYKSDPKYSSELWECRSCQSSIESQDHILWCHAYTPLRVGKNLNSDLDLTDYLKKVLKIRLSLNLQK